MIACGTSVYLLSAFRQFSCGSGRLSSKNLPTLTLFTKDNCSLCDDAMELLDPYKHQFSLEMVDIMRPENKEWLKKYQYDIPVFHLDGEFLMKHRADVDKFLRALSDRKRDGS